jgi:hypothetical protein
MTRIAYLTAATLTVALSITSAQAQNAVRTFVSAATGSDGNPCSRTAPCRSFQHAHDVTNAGGEINTLDPGGYGTVTITKSISIVSGLGEAGVLVPSGGYGIIINAGANDTVNLRGLIIEGGGVGVTGIGLIQAKSLVIENCVVRNLTSSGIALAPISDTVANQNQITISDTVVADNGGHGIYVQPGATSGIIGVQVAFNRVQVLRNALRGIGIFANASSAIFDIDAIAVDCVAAYNQTGFYALGNGPFGFAQFRVFRSTTYQNGVGSALNQGVFAEGAGAFYVSQSYLDDGWSVKTGGTVKSWGDNNVGTAAPSGLIGKN